MIEIICNIIMLLTKRLSILSLFFSLLLDVACSGWSRLSKITDW